MESTTPVSSGSISGTTAIAIDEVFGAGAPVGVKTLAFGFSRVGANRVWLLPGETGADVNEGKRLTLILAMELP